MTRQGFGQRAAIDKKRLKERGTGEDESSRLIGKCELCGTHHAFPDVRDVCPRCLRDVCYRPCQCWREE